MRSCYRSKWQLFTGTSLTSEGRYYFADEDTPFLTKWHIYGSANWHPKGHRLEQGLGEVLLAPKPWFNGEQPPVLPYAKQIGSDSCLFDGAPISEAIGTLQMQNGFPTACFVPDIPLDPLWPIASTINSCGLQLFYATMILWTYAGDATGITTAFHLLLGMDINVTFHPGTPALPDVVTVIANDFAIAVVDGTRNEVDLSLQAWYGLTPPTNVGAFGTSLQWYQASEWVHQFLVADGADPDQPIMLTGHSYGGVTVNVLAARYRLGNAKRDIRVMAFASPKPGDQRIVDLLTSCTTINIANDSDPVPIVPPDFAALFPVANFLGNNSLYVWNKWIRPPNVHTMFADGRFIANTGQELDFPTLLAYTTLILGGFPINPGIPHMTATYIARILLRCQNCEWPIDETLCLYLKTHTFAGFLLQENLFPILQENGEGIIVT